MACRRVNLLPMFRTSGTVAAIEKNSFTLTVISALSKESHAVPTAPKSMVFVIDKDTAIDGKLTVGEMPDVTYREHGGQNIALNVHASSAHR